MIKDIIWTDKAVEHIAKHGVIPDEVEECIFEDSPMFFKAPKKPSERLCVLCQSGAGRYLFIVISRPDEKGFVKIITARDMTFKERRRYLKKRR